MQKRSKNLIAGFVLIMIVFGLTACATMSDKKRLITAHGVYNSQYSAYMTETGYELDSVGDWVKTSEPALSDSKRRVLRDKKELLTEMYPMVQLYDAMVRGTVPFSVETEQQLFLLIDRLMEE